MLTQFFRITLMHDLPGLEDVYPIGDGQCAVEILFDQQDRQPLALQIKNDSFEMLHHYWRQAFGWLIHKDQLRIDHQRAADREHAALAAGQLSAAVMSPLRNAPKNPKHPINPPPPLPPRPLHHRDM